MKKLLILIFITTTNLSLFAQKDQASLILDLKKARASYILAKDKYENDKELLDNKAISETEFDNSQNEFLNKEIEYQKLLLKLISDQSYVIVEKAIKYQSKNGERRVKVYLRSTMEGSQEYLDQFEKHFDVITPEMRNSNVYNVFVTLQDMNDNIIIGSPYKIRIPAIEMGKTVVVDFKLLKDLESVRINLTYDGGEHQMNVFLEKDASTNMIDIISTHFSQESELGSSSTFDLTLERFLVSDDVYQLLVLNLPRQISTYFQDNKTDARLSQLRFSQGVNIRKLSLVTYLPDREDENIYIDKPIEFYVVALTSKEYKNIDRYKHYTDEEINKIKGGKIKLELIPVGVGRIEVKVPNLYHVITKGDSISMDIVVRNDGTRRLDNIKIETENPFSWSSTLTPNLIRSLNPEEEHIVKIITKPDKDVNVGAQEIKITTQAYAENRLIRSDDKTIRIQVEAKTPVFWTIILVLLLIGFVSGIVVFGIKISKK